MRGKCTQEGRSVQQLQQGQAGKARQAAQEHPPTKNGIIFRLRAAASRARGQTRRRGGAGDPPRLGCVSCPHDLVGSFGSPSGASRLAGSQPCKCCRPRAWRLASRLGISQRPPPVCLHSPVTGSARSPEMDYSPLHFTSRADHLHNTYRTTDPSFLPSRRQIPTFKVRM